MNQYPLVYLDHVHKNYGDAPALYDVSLNIQPGRIIGLLGPNGSGKTTIIKLINGLLQPTSGHIYLKGVKPSPDTKRIVSYLPDTTYLSDSSKVIEAVKYFQDFYDNFDSAKAMQLLRIFISILKRASEVCQKEQGKNAAHFGHEPSCGTVYPRRAYRWC